MSKKILGVLAASALAMCGTAHAGLTLDLNGSAPGGVIQADSLDWAPTSFLAQGGNTAISAYVNTAGACPTGCTFNVLTQAILTNYTPTGGSAPPGLPAFGGQITLVASYQERVVSFSNGAFPSALFQSTGVGMVEFYYNPAGTATDLTGFGFNAGTLIGRLTGVGSGSVGSFIVTDTRPVKLDGTSSGDAYPGQLTVSGFGSQNVLTAGTTGVTLDPTFFLTSITGFALDFENISIGLPYRSVKPADCFNSTETAVSVGTTGLSSQCQNNHNYTGDYSAQGSDGGYRPVVGGTNGLNFASPDFVAQTDFNSPVLGATVPEPGTLALVGLAFASMGFAAKRRRS